MKHSNSSVMCPAVPSIASPNIGLASLSFLPRIPEKWEEPLQYQGGFDPWAAHYLQRLSDLKRVQNTRSSRNNADNLSRETALPKDPRQWSREDVANWVQFVVSAHSLPSVQLDRFLMNGKALCLMTIDMFVKRVPLGGKLLYKDFQLRLSSALYS